jgi:hypothetical protein
MNKYLLFRDKMDNDLFIRSDAGKICKLLLVSESLCE